jgi:DNA-binding protein YbaB
MGDDSNRFDSLLNKNVPDKPGEPVPYTPSAPPPPIESEPPIAEVESAPGQDHTPGPSAADEAMSRVADFEQIADDMRRYAEGLRNTLDTNTERTWQITTDDEAFSVTVDGRPRIRKISVNPRAMRSTPAELAAKLTALLNEAIATSRREGAAAILDELDPGLRSAVSGAVSESERLVTREKDR